MKPKSPFENLNNLANKAVENGWFKGEEKKVVPIETKDKDMSLISLEIDTLLKNVFMKWGFVENKLPIHFKGTFTNTISYETLANTYYEVENFGKYEHGTDFYDTNTLEKAKVEVMDFANMDGYPRFKVFEEAKKYVEAEQVKGRNLVIAGFDYWKYVSENPDKAPQSIKNRKHYYYMPNGVFCNSDGVWNVSLVQFDGLQFAQEGRILDFGWDNRSSVILLEIIP